MNRKSNLLICSILLLCSAFCYADDLQTGEWAVSVDGYPAIIGQATNDHFFTRNTYNESGVAKVYDNLVSFKSGDLQTVWLWLDDDEIYQNAKVQALPPTLISANGEPYNEITYNSFQCNIYLPESIKMVKIENEDGDEVMCEQGDRLPNTADFSFAEDHGTKVIDGITYRSYTLIVSNTQTYGCHFSSRNARAYRTNGALKKDDAPLIGIYLKNTNQNAAEGRLADMIIANVEFGLKEPFLVVPQWDPNDYRFIYCSGGNNESQRYQYYERVSLYGSLGFTSNFVGQVFEYGGIYYQVTSSNAVSVTYRRDNNLYSGDISIPASVPYMGYNFDVTVIEEDAFDDCYGLTSVVVPNSVISIGRTAFQGCTALTSITFGSGVRTIGAQAFNYCNALTTVKCMGTVPPVMENSNCFSTRCYRNATLLVPNGCIETYQETNYWYKFSEIEEFALVIVGDVDGDEKLTIEDVVELINAILSNNTDPDILLAGDVNGNGRLDIDDVITIINMLLQHPA